MPSPDIVEMTQLWPPKFIEPSADVAGRRKPAELRVDGSHDGCAWMKRTVAEGATRHERRVFVLVEADFVHERQRGVRVVRGAAIGTGVSLRRWRVFPVAARSLPCGAARGNATLAMNEDYGIRDARD